MLITITGASGSGKSFVANYLASLGQNFAYLSIDEIGHNALDNEQAKKEISIAFGIPIFQVTRKIIGEIVFNNRASMQKLSDITWELMQKEIDEFIRKNKGKHIILDWILLPKTKYFEMADVNILVEAPQEVRIKRAMARDGISKEAFLTRNNNTPDYSDIKFDYIIRNEKIEKTRELVRRINNERIISS